MDYQAPPALLAGRTILVTGAGDGIGKQAALSFAKFGATVILLGKTVKKLEAVYDQIQTLGAPQAAIIPLDLKGATEQHYRDMAMTIESQFGKLDGLLHNASLLGVLGQFGQIEQSTWDEVMQINVTAQFMMTKYLLPVLARSEDASVVFTSSSVGKKGRAYWGAYSISKFATEGMMQVLADELENTKIRVNSINPGATKTRMRASAYPGEDSSMLKTPADIMPLYLYLMGQDSTGIRGQSFDAQPK